MAQKFKNDPKKKRYYWLQLKEDFFNQKEIKLLRRIAGGDTYTIIYLKMLLLSLRDQGKLYFEAIGDNFSEEIALSLDESPEDVAITITYLEKKGLLEIVEDDEYFLNRVPELLGSESYSAERMRDHRKRKKEQAMLQSDGEVSQCDNSVRSGDEDIDIELEKDIDIEKSRSREEGIKKIYRYYESNGFGTLAQKTMQDFDYWVKDLMKIGATEENAIEIIIHSLGIAVDRNKRNYGYANAILKDWEQKGFTKVSDILANDKKNSVDEPKMPDYSLPDEFKNQFDDIKAPDFEMPY